MDLRWRLVAWLSAFFLALLATAVVLVGFALREDVAEEVEASTHLAELMLAVHEAREGSPASLERLAAGGELRHVSVSLERSGTEQALRDVPEGGLLDWFADRLPGAAPQALRIPVGDDTLLVSGNPRSETVEILRDAMGMLVVLMAFAVVSVAAAWYAVHRALGPVRELEAGLERLTRGETGAGLPPFELREFRRIARAIDRLAQGLAESRAAERLLARRLIDVQEAERRDLARELHDELGQSLTAVGVAAAFVERHAGTAEPASLVACARDIRSEAAQMSSHVRGLLRALRPHGLEGLGIVDALSELVAGWRQRETGIALEARLPEALPRLAPTAGLALYRTLQEALTNVLRHSGARRAWVTLAPSTDGVYLTVSDDGCGRAAHIRPGGGLMGMRERVAMACGHLEIGDAKGGGLELTLWLPANDKEENDDHTDPVAR